MARYLRIILSLAAAVAATAIAVDSAAQARPLRCPAAPKPLAGGRPAMLGSVFPTPRGYVYTSAKRRSGAAIVSGYMKMQIEPATQAWFNTVAGAARYHATWKVGTSHGVVQFKGMWGTTEHGQVDVYATCASRVTAVVTLYAR